VEGENFVLIDYKTEDLISFTLLIN